MEHQTPALPPPASQRPREPPGQARGAQQPHRANLILALGILGLVLQFILCGPLAGPLGIAAWVMGNRDLAAMQAGRMIPLGRDTTNTGRLLGIIATCIFLIWVAIFMLAGVWYFMYGRPPAEG